MTDGITRIRSKLGCPLWVKSGHVQRTSRCPLVMLPQDGGAPPLLPFDINQMPSPRSRTTNA